MDFVLVYPPSSERAAEFPVGGLFLADALHKRGYSCGIICDKPLDEIFKDTIKVYEMLPLRLLPLLFSEQNP